MRKYDFNILVDREGTGNYKYDKRTEVFGRADVIPMWVADTDFPVAPFIAEAVIKRAEYPIYGYDFRGDGFFESVAAWIKVRNGWEIEKDWIVFTPGVVAGLSFGVLTFSDMEDAVVIQPPVYPPFSHLVKANGRRLVNNPLILNGERVEIDFDDLDKKLAGAKILMLCNPQNPTGRVFTHEELSKIGELCVRHDVVILSDEIHSDLIVKPHKHVHIASLSPEVAARTVTLIAPSKTFNIAGLSTSVAIIPDAALREKYRATADRLHVGDGNTFGPVAFEAAYRGGAGWLDELMEYIGGNIAFVEQFVSENLPMVKVYKTEGTYLMWLDFSAWGMSHEQLKQFMIEKAGLGLSDGFSFGREGLLHMRMNVGTSRAVIEKAMNQLLAAYNSSNG